MNVSNEMEIKTQRTSRSGLGAHLANERKVRPNLMKFRNRIVGLAVASVAAAGVFVPMGIANASAYDHCGWSEDYTPPADSGQPYDDGIQGLGHY